MIIKRDVIFTPAGKSRRLHIYLPDSCSCLQAGGGFPSQSGSAPGSYPGSGSGFSSGPGSSSSSGPSSGPGSFSGPGEGERYPVMYFFDGHNLFEDRDATFGKSWGLRDFLDSWGKDMIIVGIECGHEGNERLREYCPYTFRGKFWGGTLRGTGKETLQWIVSELKPMIDREYRTWPHREATGIGGSSMGGLMSLYGAVCFNQWFSKAACVSSTISPCMAAMRRDIRRAELDPDTRIYLSFGTEEAFRPHPTDPMQSLTAIHNLTVQEDLRGHGVMTDLFCQIGGHHSEASWEQQIPRFMDFLWM